MNTKNNQRRRDTDERLFAAYREILEAGEGIVTVSQLCGRAGVNRATFYAHFDCMRSFEVELVHRMFRQMMARDEAFARGEASFTDVLSIRERLLGVISYLREHEAFLQRLLGSAAFSDMLNQIGLRDMGVVLRRLVGLPKEQLDDESETFRLAFSGYGMTGILRNWLAHGCEMSDEELCDRLLEAVDMRSASDDS